MLGPPELHHRAQAATNAGRHLRAVSLVQQALERSPDAALRARLLATWAYAETELGHLDRADDLASGALATHGLDTETRGTLHGQRAVVLLRRGRRSEALAEFGHAIRTLTHDRASLARNLLNRGNLHLESGDARRALADFEAAATEATAAGEEGLLAKARHNEGYAAFLLGDHVRALTAMDAAAPHLAGLSPTSQAIGLQDRAEVLAAAGLREDAVADLRRAIGLFRAGRARRAEASATLLLARMLAPDDPRSGLELARRSARRFRAMGAEVSALRAEAVAALCARAAGLRGVGDPAPLLRRLREAGLRTEAGQLTVASCAWLLQQGRLDEARALRLPPSTTRDLDPWAALVAAQRQAALGRRGAALAGVRRTLDAALTLQSTLGSLELQTSLSGALTRLGRLGLSLALQRGDPAEVLQWSECTRAASSRVVSVRPPDDPEQAADLAELRGLVAAGTDPERQLVLRARVRERAWRASGSGSTRPVVDLPTLHAALADPEATFVALLECDGQLAALVVDARRALVRRLGPSSPVTALIGGLAADLDVAAADLPGAVAARVRSGLATRLRELDAALLAPLAGVVSERVVLAPSGLLAQVPWPLLPSLAGRPVTVVRSATAWTNAPPAGTLRRALLVAGPRLDRAEDEVAACAEHWPEASVLTGAKAGIRGIGRVAASVDLVHLAAHGTHHAQNPLFSHVDLADGPVFGYDLDRLGPLPSVVVLSSCDLGARTPGDDPLGLATALLHAGVRTVLASPAALSDAAACALMPRLHARLATGQCPADALAASLAEAGPDAPPLVCFGAGW